MNSAFYTSSLFWAFSSLLSVVFPVWWGVFAFMGFAVLIGGFVFLVHGFQKKYAVEASCRQDCCEDEHEIDNSDRQLSSFGYVICCSQQQERLAMKFTVVVFGGVLFGFFSLFFWLESNGIENYASVKTQCQDTGPVMTALRDTALWTAQPPNPFLSYNQTIYDLLQDKCDVTPFYITSFWNYILACLGFIAFVYQIFSVDTPFHSGLYNRVLPSIDINLRFWDNPSAVVNDLVNIAQVVKHVGDVNVARKDPAFAHLNWRLVEGVSQSDIIKIDDYIAMRSSEENEVPAESDEVVQADDGQP